MILSSREDHNPDKNPPHQYSRSNHTSCLSKSIWLKLSFSSLFLFFFCKFHLITTRISRGICRIPQIYEEFYHTINNADHEKDLKWWSNNHGLNMAMNWPQFEVSAPQSPLWMRWHICTKWARFSFIRLFAE